MTVGKFTIVTFKNFLYILGPPPIKLKRSKTFSTTEKPRTHQKEEDLAPVGEEQETYVRILIKNSDFSQKFLIIGTPSKTLQNPKYTTWKL